MRNSIVREGLRRIFTDAAFAVLESVSDLGEIEPVPQAGEEPHILVLERELLHGDHAEAIAEMQQAHPGLRIVILTATFDFDEMVALYAAGAYAYFPDQVPYLSLVAILQMVSAGQKVAPPEVIDFLVAMPAASRRSASVPALETYNFRERELRVLEHLAIGQPNKAISRHMGINEAAVKAAVKAILRKLSVDNRTQAAVMARELVSLHSGRDFEGDSSSPPQDKPRPNGSFHDDDVNINSENIRNTLSQNFVQKAISYICYIPFLPIACLS
ncbi:LuxR C-terminal-related transcriptional regulator [Novosphingobium resinovorum]|uniref:LuxR C-terminal-related transcriptional regulator n=1 Tax=Novosphingobium resinovorum TaxID=158500 RepID=UPI002ED0D62C|nr:LuxR C-terminal-related transcriptional regulator [Novosphingobium resinovorum]